MKLKDDLEILKNAVRPVSYHNRTGHKLSEQSNQLQIQINNINQFTKDNQMKINKSKTKIMLFNRSRKWDFQPNIQIDNTLLDIEESTKLLGVIISSDLKWSKNVQNMTMKARKKLWMLKRIRMLGGSCEDLLLVYTLQIRCLLEQACPVWNGALTQADIKSLEKIQKTALKIILKYNYQGYKNALIICKLKTLSERREELCTRFAEKTSQNPKFSSWFQPTKRQTKTTQRQVQPAPTKFIVPRSRTKIYGQSPIFYLTKLLNK